MTVNLIILPLVQIALYIFIDYKYNRDWKWLVLLFIIILSSIYATIAWDLDIEGEERTCGTGKFIVQTTLPILHLIVHAFYWILKKYIFE